jgi:DNA-binding transcriptional ArsR family regulator
MVTEDIFKALADPTRLRIARLLGTMELAVGELAQVLGQSQPRVSRHVGILCDAGLAERRREGSWVFLRQSDAEGPAAPIIQAAQALLVIEKERLAVLDARWSEEKTLVDELLALRDAGWHFSWLGGQKAALAKLGSFCHPEVAERTLHGLKSDRYLREGMHLDGRIMKPVDVNDEWPAYIVERRCPTEWFRPR